MTLTSAYRLDIVSLPFNFFVSANNFEIDGWYKIKIELVKLTYAQKPKKNKKREQKRLTIPYVLNKANARE